LSSLVPPPPVPPDPIGCIGRRDIWGGRSGNPFCGTTGAGRPGGRGPAQPRGAGVPRRHHRRHPGDRGPGRRDDGGEGGSLSGPVDGCSIPVGVRQGHGQRERAPPAGLGAPPPPPPRGRHGVREVGLQPAAVGGRQPRVACGAPGRGPPPVRRADRGGGRGRGGVPQGFEVRRCLCLEAIPIGPWKAVQHMPVVQIFVYAFRDLPR